jgi:hypothetical protein
METAKVCKQLLLIIIINNNNQCFDKAISIVQTICIQNQNSGLAIFA